MVGCSAYACTNRLVKGGNISFHKFPNDPIMRQKWIIATKWEKFNVKEHTKLCSKHFQPSDFLVNFGRKTIKPDAVPSIFKLPAHLRKREPKERSTRLARTTVTPQKVTDISLITELPVPTETPIEKEKTKPTLESFNFSDRKSNSKTYHISPVNIEGEICNNTADLPESSPNTQKWLMWKIDNKRRIIERQRGLIRSLRQKLKRSEIKVKKLRDLTNYLKSTQKIS